MHRVQVQFTEQQIQGLRRISAESGKSIAALVREGVDRYLDARKGPARDELVRRALSISGKYRSGPGDVARNHDRYLADAFER